MIIGDEVKRKELVRKGKVTKVVLPEGDTSGLYTLNICKAKHSVEFEKGESVYIVDKQVGVFSEVEFVVFFAKDILIVEPQWGSVYVKNTEGRDVKILETGEAVVMPEINKEINWLDSERLKNYINYIVKNKYNLQTVEEVESYVSNLIFVVQASTKLHTVSYNGRNMQTNSFKLKVVDFFDGLGLGEFEYTVKEKIKKVREEYISAGELADIEGITQKADYGGNSRNKQELYNKLKDDDDIVESENTEDYGFTEASLEDLENMEKTSDY